MPVRTKSVLTNYSTANVFDCGSSLSKKVAQSRIWQAGQGAKDVFGSYEIVPEIPGLEASNGEDPVGGCQESGANKKQ